MNKCSVPWNTTYSYKKNEVLIYAVKCMDHENMCLVKKASNKRPHITGFHVQEMSRKGKFTETGIRSVVA